MFAIIETTDKNNEKEVSVVSTKWINEESLSWPNTRNLKKLLETHATPTDTWTKYSYKLLQTNIETLAEAKKRERVYEIFSNSETEAVATKKKKFESIDLNKEFDETSNYSTISIINSMDTPSNENVIRGNENHINTQLETPLVACDYISNNIIFENDQNLIVSQGPIHISPEIQMFHNNNQKDDNINIGQVFRCNATVGMSNTCDSIQFNEVIQENTLVNSDNLAATISNLTAEIKSLKNYVQEMENTIKPIVQLIPDLILFIRQKTNNAIEKDPSFTSPEIPFTNVIDVEHFNEKLLDTSFCDQMMLFLKLNVEGRKINKNIRNILEKMIDQETLNKFTWTGAINVKKEKVKKAFVDLPQIILLVENTINYRFKELGFPATSRSDIRKNFVDVLKRAAERYKYVRKKDPVAAA